MAFSQDDYVKDKSLRRVLCEALSFDGEHHKQWYLDQLLRRVVGKDEYERLYADEDYGGWDTGIAP